MHPQQIDQVRRFNRLVTQRVGVLEESYLRRGRPLAEARVIFETGPNGTDISTLRTTLALDSGYLSRLLRSLEAQELITVDRDPNDARRRRVNLTPKGNTEFTQYDQLSDELATSMLSPLEDQERDRLLDAMRQVERLLRAAGIEVRTAPPESPEARWALNEYYQELNARFEAGFDPGNDDPATDPDMAPPAGCFAVAWLDGAPVACGALKRLDPTTGEIKRVWTAPSTRGLGIARKLMRFLEDFARKAHYTTVRLDTNKALTEAQTMYRQLGYQETARYNANPYAHHWFMKTL